MPPPLVAAWVLLAVAAFNAVLLAVGEGWLVLLPALAIGGCAWAGGVMMERYGGEGRR